MTMNGSNCNEMKLSSESSSSSTTSASASVTSTPDKGRNGLDITTATATATASPTANIDFTLLRERILSCPGLDPNCEAIQLALSSLDDARIHAVPMPMHTQMHPMQMHTLTPMQHREANMNMNMSTSTTKPNDANDANANKPKKKKKILITLTYYTLRTILIDIPLLLLFLTFLCTSSLSHIYQHYLSPQLHTMTYTDTNRTDDITYYHRVCPLGQMSTTNANDLYIGDDFTTEDCVQHMMVHGASMYKNILSKETAQSLREYIIHRNQNLKPSDEIGVLENANRWSFGIGANDHPSVVTALQELMTHDVLKPALEGIAGQNPGLIEMTAITAGYGATDQFWHPDVISMGSPAKYARSFLPSYALFVTLQDTTAKMGATGVCPGTYQCTNEDATETCENYGFQVAGNDPTTNIWKTGTGILMNQQGFHRGAAHTDPTAPDRVVFIITFSPQRLEVGETRMLGQGGSYSTRWDMWGHTLVDLQDAGVEVVQPWTTLRALGLYKPRRNNGWGWDYITQMSHRCATFGTGFETWEDFRDTLAAVPDVLLVKNTSEKMTFDEYFAACIEMWRSWAEFVNKAAVVSYLAFFSVVGVLALAFSTSLSKKMFKGIFWSSIRVASQYALVASLSYCIYKYYFLESSWTQEIRDGRYMLPPYSAADKLESLVNREPIVIYESSILITDRFNFKFLNSLADSPKYHPGNMELASKIQGCDETFHFLNREDKASLADIIVDDVIGDGSNFVVHNHDAIWVPLTLEEAKSYVAKELYLQNNPLLASLEREASFLLSSNRYGYSVMGRRFSVVDVNTLMDKIYAHAHVPIFDIYRSAEKMDRKKLSTLFADEKPKPRSVSVFDRNILNSNSIEMLRRETKEIGKKSNTTIVPRTQSHNKTSSIAQTLKVGDIVEGQYEGMFDEWYKGKIVKIHQGAIINVQYTDGEVDYELGTANVRKFVPYRVGELVEASTPRGEFLRARIMKKVGTEYIVRSRETQMTVEESGIRRFI